MAISGGGASIGARLLPPGTPALGGRPSGGRTDGSSCFIPCRGADAAGFCTALYAGLDVVGPLTKTEFGHKFRDIVAAEDVPDAVSWRAGQFRE